MQDCKGGVVDFENPVEPLPLEVTGTVELSLNSVIGLTTSGTMKLRGKIGSQEVIVLIDCGATHNFISLEVVQKIGLPITVTNNYGVMGTGELVTGKGMCKGVVLELQGLTIIEDFLLLD